MTAKILEINKKSKAQRIKNHLNKRLYTISEGAYYLGRSVYSLRTLIWNGQLPIIKKGEGGKIWIDREDIDKWILKNKTEYQPLPAIRKKKKNKEK
jgi:excisionase family DNA binding protein